MVNDITKYEYKSPSYELKNREGRYTVDNKFIEKNTRFIKIDDNNWKSLHDKKDHISLLFAGDLLCQENITNSFRISENKYDFTLIYEHLKPIFKSSDFVAGNLETPISETAPYRGEILTHEGPYYCNAPIEYLEALKYAGFDMLTTANNHTLDAGARGLLETVENANEFKFIQTGTFFENRKRYVIVDICGFKIGLTAFSTTYNTMDSNLNDYGKDVLLNTYSSKLAKEIYKDMITDGAEYIICFPHWGKEFTTEISIKQNKMANRLTKIGYDFVVGSHSHVVQNFEYVNKKPVLFSLGNLLTHINIIDFIEETSHPVLLNLVLTRDNNNKIKSNIEFIPCRIIKNLKNIPFSIVPYCNDLLYDEEIKKAVLGIEEYCAGLLHAKLSRMNTNYLINNQELNIYKSLNLESKTKKLLKKQNTILGKNKIDLTKYPTNKSVIKNFVVYDISKKMLLLHIFILMPLLLK